MSKFLREIDSTGLRHVNVGTPTQGTDAATKAYVDAVVQGLSIKQSVRVATTGNLNLSSPGGTIDGVTMANGDRVLVKNQTTASQNGIYVWNGATSAMTRSDDANTAAELTGAIFVFVTAGSSQADSGWVQTQDSVTTVDTSAVNFTQFSGAGQIDAGTGLTKTGNQLNVGAGTGISVAADTVGIDTSVVPRLNTGNAFVGAQSVKSSIALVSSVDNTVGTIDASTGEVIFINNNGGYRFQNSPATDSTLFGSQQLVPKSYVDGVAAKRFSVDVGDNSAVAISKTHNLGTRDIIPILRSNSSPFEIVVPDFEATDNNNIMLRFAVAPTTNQYRLTVLA